jgi:hypothetical protein
MRLKKKLAFLPALLFMIASAYGQDVHYNYAPGTNFSAYKTYEWVELPGPGATVPDQLIDQSIQRAVDEQLAQKGLTRVEKDRDLKVGYHALLHEEKAIDLNGFGTGPGPWGGGGLGGWGSGTVTGQTSTIPVGMLLIDLYDSSTKLLIWRGDAAKTLDVKKSPDKNYRELQKAMTKLFKNYPPAPGK